jgi:hypothetical protein
MMKQDKTVKLLLFHKEPDRRLSAFMIFRDEMQTICKLYVNFIITHCDQNTRETLVNFAADHRTTYQSGVLAFKHLERMFAPSDINATQKATTEYMTIFPKNEETISNFNHRFNHKLRIAVICGYVTDAPTVIDHYLLLPSYRERSYNAVANKVSAHDTDETEISDKKSRSTRSKANKVTKHQQGFNQERSNNRSDSTTSQRPQTDITCYGCGKQGHAMNKCRTTSAKDRKAIWERMKENSHPQPSQAHATKTRRPPPNPLNSAQTIQESNRTRPQQYPSTTFNTDFLPTNTRPVQAPSHANAVRHMAYINAVHLPIQPRIIYYDTEVIIDSGTSDHMANDESKLFQVYPSIHDVQLPDGSILTSSLAGLMRVSCTCLDTNEEFIVPLTGTILIPGFTICLWSVTSFNDSGHEVIFGTSTIRVIMNKDTPDELEIRLNQPFQQDKTGRLFANMVHASLPPRKRTKVSMNLMHQRLQRCYY